MKNTLAVIAVFLAGLMNLPYLTEQVLKITPRRVVVENTDHDVVELELNEGCHYYSDEPVIGLELKEYIPNYQEVVPSGNVEEGLLICNTPCVKYQYTCAKQRYRPLQYIRHRRPIRRLLGCLGVRYYRCRRHF